jgi:hypothetical protein
VEVPLSKVTVPLPKVPAMKGSNESDRDFVARLATGADRLVGSYGTTGHGACLSQIHNDHLNRVF